jgi:hypothetical protein
METETPELTREQFQDLVKEKVLLRSIAKTFEAAEKVAEEFLNPFIESSYIEGFDTDFNEDTKGFHIAVHFADAEDLNFTIQSGS